MAPSSASEHPSSIVAKAQSLSVGVEDLSAITRQCGPAHETGMVQLLIQTSCGSPHSLEKSEKYLPLDLALQHPEARHGTAMTSFLSSARTRDRAFAWPSHMTAHRKTLGTRRTDGNRFTRLTRRTPPPREDRVYRTPLRPVHTEAPQMNSFFLSPGLRACPAGAARLLDGCTALLAKSVWQSTG